MSEALFARKAPGIMRQLMADFDLTVEDAAAILGNIGHECGGFSLLQEQKPTVKGSKGGWGWAQWTGPRRRAMEAYCKRNSLDPASDKANYAWLFLELKGTEKGAIPKLKNAKGLANKVVAFELGFERAGVKHYPSRQIWAQRAIDAYRDNTPVEPVIPSPEPPKPSVSPAVAAVISAAITALLAVVASLSELL